MAQSTARVDTATAYLQAAEALIGYDGLDGVRVRALAEAAGRSRGALHYHFGSVGELIDRAAENALARILAKLSAALAEPGSPTEKLARSAMALDARDRQIILGVSTRAMRNPSRGVWTAFVCSWEWNLKKELGGLADSQAALAVTTTLGLSLQPWIEEQGVGVVTWMMGLIVGNEEAD